MKVTHAAWELDNLNVNAYEILLDAADTPDALAREEARLVAEGAQYLAVKTPVNCPRLLFGLPALGYAFVETVFHVSVKREEYRVPALVARFDRGLAVARRDSGADLKRIDGLIRRGVFVSDRISLDPAFTREQSGARYANWLQSMVAKGGKVYEVVRIGAGDTEGGAKPRLAPEIAEGDEARTRDAAQR